MNTLSDKKPKPESSVVQRISRYYIAAMGLIITMFLVAYTYINLSYLYTDELIDMANRVALQFENILRSREMEDAFSGSRTNLFLDPLNDLNKYSRPEKVRIFVVFPNGVTSRYDEENDEVTFEKLPAEFFGVFRKSVQTSGRITEYPKTSNGYQWVVAVPIRGYYEKSGGLIITSIYVTEVLRRLYPVFAVVGISLLLAFWLLVQTKKSFIRTLGSPLENIIGALEHSSLNDFQSEEIRSQEDEIGKLARALDEVAVRLEKEQKLRDQDDENRRNFFHNVSHELKTPVAAMRAQAELLHDGLATEEELPGYYESILKDTIHLQNMVDDLLTLTRLQTPGYHMDLEPCCMAEILDDVYQSMSAMAQEKGVSLTLCQELSPEQTLVKGNYTRIRQIAIIFVENSIKYSEAGTQTQIILRENSPDTLELIVQDEGCGIPEDEIEQVFRNHYRASNTKNVEGNGLGLAIACGIADYLKFRIWLESKEHVGTSVHVFMPRLQEADSGETDSSF